MSYTEKKSLVHEGDWDESTDSHPAMKWMHAYTNEFDKGEWDTIWDSRKWLADDFTYAKATGEIFPPGKESWDAVRQTYAFFTNWYHEPYFVTCWELDNDEGWAMIGNAWVHYNLPGDSAGPKVKDAQGREWQGRVPGGFHFIYKKQSGGEIRLATTSVTSDSGPIVVEMLRRGIMKPSDLGL